MFIVGTPDHRWHGQIAVRSLSDKAQYVYNNCDWLEVFAYRDWDPDGCYTWFYAYYDGFKMIKDLSIEQLEQALEDYYISVSDTDTIN